MEYIRDFLDISNNYISKLSEKSVVLENVFKILIDLIASICGLEKLYDCLTEVDAQGNNILMCALKVGNEKIGLKVIELIEKTISNDVSREQIEHKLITQCDSNGNNLLMLLTQHNESLFSKKILLMFEKHPDNWLSIIQQNAYENNALTLSLIHKNDFLLENITFKN